MFIEALNSKKEEMLSRGKIVGTIEGTLIDFINEAIVHPENRDHISNYKANEHHKECKWCPSKMNITMHFISETGVWYIGSGNTRKHSFEMFIEKRGIEALDQRFIEQDLQVTINICKTLKESIKALKNSGGSGVSWKASELDTAAKKLANILPGNDIFESLGIKSAFNAKERKNLEDTYAEYEQYLVPIFNFLEYMSKKGKNINHQERSAKGVTITLNHVKVFQAGIIRGLMTSMKEGIPFELIRGCMFELASKNDTHFVSSNILSTLLAQRVRGAQGEAKIREQAKVVLDSLTMLHQMNYVYSDK